ncbi:MAG: dephospho-CoA kinase [Paramuribaculum sp.]|nr:dephospho-CoA kinase [Paramuribaculum sp.]
MALIAITGGIGSGKSVVSRILSALGYSVYDCDVRAKQIMDKSSEIKSYISKHICPDAITSHGDIDRAVLAQVVFNDSGKLELLNSVVHNSVKSDLTNWASDKPIAFVETAILYQSGLDMMVDCVWEVTAPEEIRICRVIKRNNITAEQVKARIKSQDDFVVTRKHPAILLIENDGTIPLLPQILTLLATP